MLIIFYMKRIYIYQRIVYFNKQYVDYVDYFLYYDILQGKPEGS